MRCYFHLIKGDAIIRDDIGVEVADVDEARREAMTTISEMATQEPNLAREGAGWTLIVTDPAGAVLVAIPLDDIVGL
jgi:hypothetical protein